MSLLSIVNYDDVNCANYDEFILVIVWNNLNFILHLTMPLCLKIKFIWLKYSLLGLQKSTQNAFTLYFGHRLCTLYLLQVYFTRMKFHFAYVQTNFTQVKSNFTNIKINLTKVKLINNYNNSIQFYSISTRYQSN